MSCSFVNDTFSFTENIEDDPLFIYQEIAKFCLKIFYSNDFILIHSLYFVHTPSKIYIFNILRVSPLIDITQAWPLHIWHYFGVAIHPSVRASVHPFMCLFQLWSPPDAEMWPMISPVFVRSVNRFGLWNPKIQF